MSKNLIIIIIIVVVIIAGGFFLFKNSSNQTSPATISPTSQTSQQAESPSPSEAMSQNTVTLTQNGFEPQTITITVGEKVTWINKSGDVATVNSDVHPTHLLYPPLNLGQFTDGKTMELTFPKAGTFTYHDHYHPNRTGKVIVQ
jgi:plastocyanin